MSASKKVKAFGFILNEKEGSNKFGSVSCSEVQDFGYIKDKNGFSATCNRCCYQIVDYKTHSEDNCLIRYLRNKMKKGDTWDDSLGDESLSKLIYDNLEPYHNFKQEELEL